MNYYKDILNAYRKIDELFTSNDGNIEVDRIVYQITLIYPISEKKVRQRIDLLQKIRGETEE
jgi:hypothetical protein